VGPGALEGGGNEPAEQRVRAGWPDRNSGWAWVRRKNGCRSRRNSANSTSRPSGDRPENTHPGLLQPLTVTVVDFVPVPVPFLTLGSPYSSRTRVPSASSRGTGRAACAAHVRSPLPHPPGPPCGDHRVRGGRVELGAVAPSRPARCRAASMTRHCRPEAQAEAAGCVRRRTRSRRLALDPAHPEAAGDEATPSAPRAAAAPRGSGSVTGTQRILDLGVVGEAARPQRLGGDR